MAEERKFDAPAHMRKIRTRQGMQDYLDVKWRLLWLRSEYPDARVVTEQIEGSIEHARFKCTITLPNGAIGTGHGSETQGDFPDFYEKAETKSIGRACAVLGYGTDAATDFDDGEPMDGLPAAKSERAARNSEGPPAQGPPRPAPNQPRPAPPTGEPIPIRQESQTDQKSNVHQLAQIRALAERGFNLSERLKALNLESLEDLTREQAKEIIVAGRAALGAGFERS